MAINRIILRVLLLAALLPGAALCMDPEISPQNAQAAELSSVKDRLLTSLFFRGELADLIIGAGMAEKFVDLEGLETNSEIRSALLGWIKKNPAEAAALYLHLRGGEGPRPTAMQAEKSTWELNPGFLSLVKNLNAAAGNSAVSDEELETAARRLYGGPQARDEASVVTAGAAPAGSGFFSLNYADYRLNKAGLEREVSASGAWLEGARGASGRGPAGLEKAYGAALAEYGAFVVAASSVKGRSVITEAESRGLEGRRASLRGRIAGLALRSRAADLGAITAALAVGGRKPGLDKLLADIAALKTGLEDSAARIDDGAVPFGGLRGLARGAEKEFAALYLRYSAYNGLAALRKRVSSAGFSCFYDYAVYRYLAAFFPEAAYPRARAELANAAAALDPALEAAGEGRVAEALSGLGGRAAAISEAERVSRGAAAFNRGAQYFLWGFLFRPFELGILWDGGRPAYRPVFTFSEVVK